MRFVLCLLLSSLSLLSLEAADQGQLDWGWLKGATDQPLEDQWEQGVWKTAYARVVGEAEPLGVSWIPPRNWSIRPEPSKQRLRLSAPDLHGSIFLRLLSVPVRRSRLDWKGQALARLKELDPEIQVWEQQARTNGTFEVLVLEGRRVVPRVGELITHVEVLRFPAVVVELALVTNDASRFQETMIILRRMIDAIRPLTQAELAVLAKGPKQREGNLPPSP